jgi:hypothetical protein
MAIGPGTVRKEQLLDALPQIERRSHAPLFSLTKYRTNRADLPSALAPSSTSLRGKSFHLQNRGARWVEKR